ncbi:hypothetical protein AWM75_02270 [Aerococcus urinaehominis]|uniref:Uncharacterized protein n=1 Tax=Aerococcus urinaehominis TaxID=128944 RepID=A0A0X8FLL6_9LACT|nr:DUF948 domain-containing protein [Aerococcus urinaehominis]AMB98887.1 hypothetical protein AWM75_02270 [Aerococcus urinaehominis]SDM15897.1 Uncharacterized protein YoxC, contains an MCP-like domain [Aerococcus urinaehominis]
MSWNEVAALIAAIAFAVLVIFLVLFVRQLTKTISEVTETVDEVNKTIAVLRQDVDGISLEAQGLLNKSNTLLNDINGKVELVDPLFKAIGDVGVTVSEVNDSTKQLVLNVTSTANDQVDKVKAKVIEKEVAKPGELVSEPQVSTVKKLGKTAKALRANRRIKKAEAQSKSQAF